MRLQIIQDDKGNNAGVFVPIQDWNLLVQKHEDLKALINIAPSPKKKLSDLAGKLSGETGAEMIKFVEETRNQWEERVNKQFKS